MNTTPKGKIGRLPMPLREQVNRRLENGEKGLSLVAWLNSRPEVQAVLAAEFNGQPISPQNLSLWRRHGFKDWLRYRQAQAMATELGELPVAPDSPVGEQMAAWASVRYLMTVRELVENNEGQSHLKVLREFLRDVIALRRGDHRTARLKLDQERLKLEP